MGWEAKNQLSCQSKHGLVGSSAKKEIFYLGSSRSEKHVLFLGSKHKSAIWDGTPPPAH